MQIQDPSSHQRELLSCAARLARVGGWELLGDMTTLVCTDEIYRIHGLPVAPAVLLDELLSLYGRGQRSLLEGAVRKCLENGSKCDLSLTLDRPGRAPCQVQVQMRVVYEPDGSARLLGSMHDQTARYFAESQTRLLETCVAHLHDIVLITEAEPQGEPDGPRIVFVNDAFERRTGYSRAEVLGKTPRILQGPLTDRVETARIGAELRAWRPVRAELINYTKSGEAFWLELNIVPVADSSGWFTHWIAVERDITERKMAELASKETYLKADELNAELEGLVTERSAALTQQGVLFRALAEQAEALSEAKDHAVKANLAKSQFLANISHEIRTPLNAVLGMHRMLRATDLQPRQAKLLSKADHAGNALMEIINDVLDLAKIEAGEMSFSTQAFQPRLLFEELQEIYQPGAHTKGLVFTLDNAVEIPKWIVGDRFRMRQVLSNLIGNAIKFTSVGEVKMSTHVGGTALSPKLVMIVRDTGVGISEEAAKRLFSPFVQADESTTRQFGGTGLGLSIVRTLAQLMGGTAHVSSQLGVGSEFLVELPITYPDEHAVAQAAQAARPIEIALMLADDPLCEEIVRCITTLGWTCFRPMADETGKPDVLLIDACLGIASRAKASELDNACKGQGQDLLKVLVVNPNELAATDSLAHHCILQKPVDASSILDAALNLVAQSNNGQDRLIPNSAAVSGAIQWLHGVRLLVVDDSEINLEIAVALLERQGADCHSCSNGREAVDWLLAHPNAVDAVLMDVQMPVLDGLAATRLIKSFFALRNLPVIALTSGALASERDRTAAAGMDDFLSKPLEPLQIVKVLRSQIRQARGRAPQVKYAGSNAADVENQGLVEIASSWPTIVGIDKAKSILYSCESLKLFNSLLALFLKNYLDWSATWQERSQKNGAEINADLFKSLHKLRGSAGMLGATEISATVEEVETSLQSAEIGAGEAVRKVSTVLDLLLARIAEVFERPLIRPGSSNARPPSKSD